MVHYKRMEKVLSAQFYRSETGGEPVREWLLSVDRETRKTIGSHIMTVEFGWPMGMPNIRKLEADLWEIRVRLPYGIARILFTIRGKTMVLLHGFIKKTQKTPLEELKTARGRLRDVKE
jgi:phage-related protein